MPSVYDENNFIGRVNYAASVISRKGGNTRHFDTCFEMYDGDAVAAALYRRSLKNERLAINMPRYVNMDLVLQNYTEHKGKNLTKVAAVLRTKAQAKYEN